MKKPELKYHVEKMFSYSDVIGYIENKYNIATRDVLDHLNHYRNWCNKHNIPDKDATGKGRGSSIIFFQRYKDADDGEKISPEYRDFWHWFVDNNEKCINGCVMYFYFNDRKKAPDWVKEILDMIKKEFEEYIEDDVLPVWVDW